VSSAALLQEPSAKKPNGGGLWLNASYSIDYKNSQKVETAKIKYGDT
jgi:hypothetical protein